MLELEQADHALAELGADSDRMAEALVAMDGHAGQRLLAGATLTGVTLRRWTAANAAMTVLWQQFSAHRALVEQARQVRERKSRPGDAELSELTELLTGRVVEVGDDQGALVAERVTLADLVTTMKASYAQVIEVLTAAEKSWNRTVELLEPLDGELRAAKAVADSLGVAEPALDRIAGELAGLRAAAVSDPLGAEPDPGKIRVTLKKTRAELDELASTRDSFGARQDRIESVLDEAAEIDQRTRGVYATVREKIANPGLPAEDGTLNPLRDRLAELPGVWRSGDWKALSRRLGALERDADQALAGSRGRLEAGTGLLDRRLELRGRLDAYRAKAKRLGYVEDLELGELHRTAHEVLYTSPCDLRAATVAVNRYQQALRYRRGGDES